MGKMLTSGLLLVTGPRKVNGVPIKRVGQKMCIATSTKVDVSKVDVKAIDDGFFAREKKVKKKGEDAFVKQKTYEKVAPSDEKKALQAKVDGSITIKDPIMQKYMQTRFCLS